MWGGPLVAALGHLVDLVPDVTRRIQLQLSDRRILKVLGVSGDLSAFSGTLDY